MAGRTDKITKRTVDAAKPEAKLYRLWDSELKGFGLKVLPSGVKTYVVVYRPNGGGRAAPLKEYTIGRHGPLTPDEARREAEIKLGAVRMGGDPQSDREKARAEITVSALCDLYLAEGVATKKASTLKTDLYRINGHIKPLLGKKRASEVSQADIERFVRDMAKGKHAVERLPTLKEVKAKGLKVKETRRRKDSAIRGGKGTATRTLGLLGSIFSFSIKRKLRTDNPCLGVEKFKSGQSQRYLSADEMKRLGEALALPGLNGHAIAIVRLLALTGCRKGEIEGLKWPEVDFNLSILRLSDSKTGHKIVPLGAPALEVLQSLKPNKAEGYVFPAREGVDSYYIGTPKVWLAIREAAGLTDVRLHDLRHTFASLAAVGGQSLPIIGKILGHSNSRTTERYAHLADDPVRAAASRISETAAAALAGKSAEVIPLRSSNS